MAHESYNKENEFVFVYTRYGLQTIQNNIVSNETRFAVRNTLYFVGQSTQFEIS